MAQKPSEPKRANRVIGVAEAVTGALDPVFKKRGFATRDLVSRWADIVPAPFDRVTMPDKLVWPRGEKGAEGATLYLRCAPGHALAASHEGERIAGAVNPYFGYVLVGQVRLSAEPFTPHSDPKPQEIKPDPNVLAKAASAVEKIEDEELKTALRRWGQAIMSKGKTPQA